MHTSLMSAAAVYKTQCCLNGSRQWIKTREVPFYCGVGPLNLCYGNDSEVKLHITNVDEELRFNQGVLNKGL
ncbi:unnamed protein product [Linum tenue]|uniref:Uncharacterized protein n=1 Tax=Linum tenue TaxID=586396 RepID=A0AAV0H9G8_9ROSI|nr:unnamed protein product [Linum tenue]